MGDEDQAKPMMRPNDLFTASYYGDLKVLKKLLFIEPVEEDPPMDAEFDPTVPADAELEAANKERAEKRLANEAELRKRLSQQGLMVVRKSPVDLKYFGLSIKLREIGSSAKMAVQYKTSSRYMHKATPLHWAVLGREHETIRYLIENGADVDAVTPDYGISIFDIIAKNDSQETGKIVEEAKQARSKAQEGKRAAADAIQRELKRREDARVAHAAEEQRKKDEEEAAEKAAAEAEARGQAVAEAAPEEEEQ